MAKPVGITLNMSDEITKLSSIISEIGEKRAVFATKRAINKTLTQARTPVRKTIMAVLNMKSTKIKQEIFTLRVPKHVKTLDKVQGSTLIFERNTSAVGVKKTLVLGDEQKQSRRGKVIGVRVKWFKSRPAQLMTKGFVKRTKEGGTRLLKKQVWIRDGKGPKAMHGAYGPKVSDIAKFKTDEIVEFKARTLKRLLPKEFDSELRNLTVKWSRKR